MKEIKKLSQKRELCTKEKVDIMDFWEGKEVFLNGGTWKKDIS